MILLTGATGNVGRPLTRLLVDASVSFKIFARDPERARSTFGCGVEVIQGDLADPYSLKAALTGVEVLFLLNGDSAPEEAVVDVAVRSGVRRVVKQSALAEGLEPPSFHRRVEERLERSGLGWTHLRPNAFMQTLLGYLPTLISDEGILCLPAGQGRVGWVDARDIAAVAFHALTEDNDEGRTYPITGPESLSMADIAGMISEATDRSVRYEDIPTEMARERLLAAGLPPSFADFLTGFYAAVRAGAHDVVTDTVADVSGRTPYTFDSFVREYAAALGGSVT
jgi:uncharacterized protein YbjT (DUF2867 family)